MRACVLAHGYQEERAPINLPRDLCVISFNGHADGVTGVASGSDAVPWDRQIQTAPRVHIR